MNLTYQQVAKRLGKSVSFVRKQAQRGAIEVQDLGHCTKLISETALETYLKKRTLKSF